MSYIQREKHRSQYVEVDNRTVQDTRLPLDTLGLLCHLLSKPSDWIVRCSAVKADWNIGDEKMARMMRELQHFGYAVRRRQKGDNGQFIWVTTIREFVEDAHGNKLHITTIDKVSPYPGEPGMGEPGTANPGIYKGQKVQTGISEEPDGSSRYPTDSQTPSGPPRGDGELFGEAGSKQSGTPDVPQKQKGAYPQEFEDFWKAYPKGPQGKMRKVSKDTTYRKWRRAIQNHNVTSADLLLAVQRYAKVHENDEGEAYNFVCNTLKWFNQQYYEQFLGDEWEETKRQLKPKKDDSWRYMV